jgi:glycerophosphoryl diester phosphodiesterase
MKPLIIAHRGTSADAPENTMIAFRRAIEAGAHGIEFDVRLSADGVPMVIHDKSLKRVAGIERNVNDLTAAELGRTDVGSWFNRRYPDKAEAAFANETVPKLDGLFELMAPTGMLMYLELKCGKGSYQELASAAADSIRRSGLMDRIVVLSFHHEALTEIKSVLPGVRTGALFEPKALSIIRVRRKFIKKAIAHDADEIAPHFSLVTKKTVKKANEHSMPTIVWTANNPKFLKKALKMGLHAVMTNHPRRFLNKRAELLDNSIL